MLKPPMPTTSRNEELTEYFPHVVFVQNKAQYSDYTQNMISTMQVIAENTSSIIQIFQVLHWLGYLCYDAMIMIFYSFVKIRNH